VNLRVFENIEALRRGAAEALEREAALSLAPWFGAIGDAREIIPIVTLLPDDFEIHWTSTSEALRDALEALRSTSAVLADAADPLDLLLCAGPPPAKTVQTLPEAKKILIVALEPASLISWNESLTAASAEGEDRVWRLITRETWNTLGGMERLLTVEAPR
jgi:hypothetical protein